LRVPDGYTEQEVVAVVDEILGALANTFRFGFYEVDDLKQEGWIYALEALDNYDTSFGYSLNYFLYGHIRKRFINFKRNKFSRNDSPCLSCPFYDPLLRVSTNACGQFADKEECEKYFAYAKRNERKRVLNESTNSVEGTVEGHSSHDVGEDLDKKALLRRINVELDVGLRADFRRLLDGVALPKARRERVIEAVREIVGDSFG
jgi:hypothetical protein